MDDFFRFSISELLISAPNKYILYYFIPIKRQKHPKMYETEAGEFFLFYLRCSAVNSLFYTIISIFTLSAILTIFSDFVAPMSVEL